MRLPRRLCVVSLTLVLMGFGALLPAGAKAPPASRETQLRELVAKRAHVSPDRLAIEDLATLDFHQLGVQLHTAKIVDQVTGEIYQVTVDADGRPADPTPFADAEAAAATQTFGKIDQRLSTQLDALSANQATQVSIWLNVPDPAISRSQATISDGQQAQAALAGQLTAVEQDMHGKRKGVLDAVAKMGGAVHEPRYAPAVFALLTKGQITAIAKRDDVAAVYGPGDYSMMMDDAATTDRAYRVWQAGNLGNLGAGMVRPVIHEDDGVADYLLNLNNSNHAVIFYCASVNSLCPSGKAISTEGGHATEVAGIIASNHPLLQGIAPKVQVVLSANSGDFSTVNLVDAFEWARANGGDPTNMSWGTNCGGFQDFMSRYVDWAVRNLSATIVVASGNHDGRCNNNFNDPGDRKVSSPGLAWSVITVGSIVDNNNGFWSGDTVSSFSRSVNPDFATGMEKPEVMAVGQDVLTNDISADGITDVGIDGTSFAAPQVTGQVALMLSRQPGQTGWPETNKAAVLASAYHDMASGRSTDGVGAVMMNISDDTYRFNRYVNDCGASCFPLKPSDFPRDYHITLAAGQTYRFAIAWDSLSSGGGGSDVLGADIDLQIFKPDGTFLVSSASTQNAWELVQFAAPLSGSYTVRAVLTSSVSGWPGTFLGMAYSLRTFPNVCTGLSSGAGTFSISTANGPTWFDSYAGWATDQHGREYVRALVLTTTKDITVTDTNGSLDLHVIQIPSCTADPITPTVRANGTNAVFINNAAAGTYYVVVDGLNGAVGTDSLTITLSGP